MVGSEHPQKNPILVTLQFFSRAHLLVQEALLGHVALQNLAAKPNCLASQDGLPKGGEKYSIE